jgi:dephospho-CoA kinase
MTGRPRFRCCAGGRTGRPVGRHDPHLTGFCRVNRVVVIGLTGGIGAGKSTVAAMLTARGAIVVDADRIAREVVEPGGPAFGAIIERFGPAVLMQGRLDRAALAEVVFRDADARAALEAITHPAIQAEMSRQVAAHANADVVVLDIPLLKSRREPMAGVVVVDVDEDVAVRRLVEQRGFDEADARRRIAAQIARDERRAIADMIVDNSGDLAQLEADVGRVWDWALALKGVTRPR